MKRLCKLAIVMLFMLLLSSCGQKSDREPIAEGEADQTKSIEAETGKAKNIETDETAEESPADEDNTLGADPRGNLTRIDNALSQMPQRLESVKVQLDNLYQQQAAAKEEVGKAFPYEEELRVKNARLVELDMELNMDSKGQSRPEAAIAKRERPSVLEGLKRPIPPRSMEKKPRQQEQEAR